MTSSWPKSLLHGVRELCEGPIVEDVHLFRANIVVRSPERWGWLSGELARAAEFSVRSVIDDAGYEDNVDLSAEPFDHIDARRLRLTVTKTQTDLKLRFFTRDGFASALQDPSRFELARDVLVGDLMSPSRTASLRIRSWLDKDGDDESRGEFVSPRKLVRDVSGVGLVPASAATWIAEGEDFPTDARFRIVAAKRLALCLASEVSGTRDEAEAAIKGGRWVRAIVPHDDANWDPEVCERIQQASRWVYAEGRDAEPRHAILTAEIARSFPPNVNWPIGLSACLPGALECARSAYRLHLSDKGSDALKLMSELRKGLADDLRSVTTQTSALTSGLWRDMAVALGAVALKFTTGGEQGSDFIALLIALYLLCSGYLSDRAATSAVNRIQDNERNFKSRLYNPLLHDDEYATIAGDSYTRTFSEYYRFRIFILGAYFLAAFTVFFYSIGIDRAVVAIWGVAALISEWILNCAALSPR